MAVAFKASAVGNTGAGVSGSTIALAAPASIVAGDLLIVHLVHQKDATPVVSGFTQLTMVATSGSTRVMENYVFYKIATGAEASTTITVTLNGGDLDAAALLVYSDADQSSPFNTYNSTATTTAAPTSIATPSITTSIDGCTIASLFGTHLNTAAADGTLSTPASTTSRAEDHAQTYSCLLAVDEAQATGGATSARTSTSARGGGMTAIALAIRPAGGRTHQMIV